MPDDSLILLDFGLAKGGLTQQNTYGSHSLFGYSIGYASPEQMSAQGTDQRSDLYSVAATLWTLLTAERAIDAQVREQAAKHGIPEPMRPVNELNPHVPPIVAQALTRALALNPNHRPNSATEMRQQLQAEAEQKRRSQQQAQEARRQAELERLRREAEARHQAEVERLRREAETARRQAEAERKRRSQQEAQDAHRKAELEGLRREAEAARRQAEREKQQREATERRQAQWKKQQDAAAHQQRTVRPVTPPSVTPLHSSTTATHYQIARLSPINPLDHLRLLWWTLMKRQQLKAYRVQYGENAERPVSKWLLSTIIWLPLLLLVLAVGLETLPSTTTAYTPTTYPLMGGGLLIGWLLTGIFGDRENLTFILGYFLPLLLWLAHLFIIINFGMLVLLFMIALFNNVLFFRILGVRKPKGLLGEQAGFQTKANLLLTEEIESFKTGHPSSLGSKMFGLLMASYLFLVWFCFLGGWQVFVP